MSNADHSPTFGESMDSKQRRRMNRLAEDRKAVESQRQEMATQIERLTSEKNLEIKRLQDELEQERVKNQDCVKIIAQFEDNQIPLAQRISELETDLNTARLNQANLEGIRDTLRSEIETLKTSAKEESLSNLRNRLHKKTLETQELQKRVAELEKRPVRDPLASFHEMDAATTTSGD